MKTTSERGKRAATSNATKSVALPPSSSALARTGLKTPDGIAATRSRGNVPSQAVTSSRPKAMGEAVVRRPKSGQLLAQKGSHSFWRTNNFAEHYDADPMMRIDIVKKGLPAKAAGEIAISMGFSKDRLYNMLGLPRATVERKIRNQKVLSPDESARVLGVSRLIGQVQRMVEESGSPEGFDASAWVASWVERPVPALGGRRPSELMDTAEGQALVASILSRAQSGAYS